jgi:hypothetical protein
MEIFIDQMPLGPNMSAWYRPSEKVEWWFESGSPASLRKSVTLQGARTPVEQWDMADPTEIEYCSTTYSFKKGEWTTSTDPPPQSLTREADNANGQPDSAAPNGIAMNGCASNGYAIRPKHAHRPH